MLKLSCQSHPRKGIYLMDAKKAISVHVAILIFGIQLCTYMKRKPQILMLVR